MPQVPGSEVAGSDGPVGTVVSGTLPLTAFLMDLVKKGLLTSQETPDVTLYLRSHMQFRIVNGAGILVDPAIVSGLSISVASSKVLAPDSSDKFPAWGPVTKQLQLCGTG